MFLRRQAFLFAPRRVKGGKGHKSADARVVTLSQEPQTAECGKERLAASSATHCSDLRNIEEYFLRRLSQARTEFSTQASASFYPSFSPETLTDMQCRTGGCHSSHPNHNNHTTLSLKEDVRFHRRLSNRFTTVCDQEKLYGTAEIPFNTLHNDVYLRFKWAREAMQILHESIQHEEVKRRLDGRKVTLPRRLVVLVLYSHTQHGVAVGGHMKRIREIVKAMLAERYNDVLGLLTVAVGVKCRSLSTTRVSSVNGELEGVIDSSDPFIQDDVLWYPNAGLYTFNALLQCICAAAVRNTKMKNEMSPLVPHLHTKVLIVSEGWLHARTAAELHRPHSSLCEDARSVGGVATVEVEPLPYVLGSSHSEEELHQFARYTACRALA